MLHRLDGSRPIAGRVDAERELAEIDRLPVVRDQDEIDTGALCSEIYPPELFTKVSRLVWPLDPT
jgi:hypothetical protein